MGIVTPCYIFVLSICLPYADLLELLFYLSILIHPLGVTAITVLLHRDPCYHCTI